MDFDEMKAAWNTQTERPVYSIAETALLRQIQSKMSVIVRFTSIAEWALVAINVVVVAVLLAANRFRAGTNVFLYGEAAWVFCLVIYFLINRSRRASASLQFDRSVLGDIDHSIFLARYQVRLAQVIRWNFIPMGAILIAAGWEEGKLLKVTLVVLLSFSLAFYVTGSGYRMNRKRKLELEVLKGKLIAEM